MENEVMTAEEPKLISVVDIQFRPGQKVYFFDPAGLELKAGDHVIIDTARGAEFGTCTGGIHTVRESEVVLPLRSVLRLATAADERTVQENRAKEQKAFDVCHKKIGEMGLDMQLVSVECAFDGSKLLFFFTAEERVDFRELVKSLASTFHTRIELRQIGVRDKAKMVGGLGICGRPFCCTSFLEDFQPVSIKMAKTQNLSLNPTKISGTCGRLMCCLKYEQDAYEYLLSRCPKEESFVDTPEGRGTVAEVNLLRQTVKVRMEDSPETVSSFSVEEIAVLRNGKAKKNDPPIPADLAPISGKGKRIRKEKKPEDTAFLDPIKFRYREDAVVDAPVRKNEEAGEAEKPQRNRRRSTKATPEGKRPEAPKPRTDAQPKPKDAAPKQENAEQDAKPAGDKPNQSKHHGKRPNYYHRRKPKSGGGQQPQG
jgi:cell fate regulator YaaT (PSP1 superfamily)